MRRSRNSLVKKDRIGFQPVAFLGHSQAESLCHGDYQQVVRFEPGMVRLKSCFLSFHGVRRARLGVQMSFFGAQVQFATLHLSV
jgi:hypothetical protein